MTTKQKTAWQGGLLWSNTTTTDRQMLNQKTKGCNVANRHSNPAPNKTHPACRESESTVCSTFDPASATTTPGASQRHELMAMGEASTLDSQTVSAANSNSHSG